MTPGVERPEGPAPSSDEAFMREALVEARRAELHEDVPVGAVVVRDGRVIARGRNQRELDADPTAHAELLALREAARQVGEWRLEGCTMYVTLEPCFMCAGALVNARVERLVYGATDSKAGAVESLARVVTDERLNHRLAVVPGVLAEEAGDLLRRFFRSRRP